MKKFFQLSFAVLCAALTFTSCLSDGDDTIVLEDGTTIVDGEDITQVVSTSESTTFVRVGFEVTVPYGAVPTNNTGGDGRVAFSISRVDEDELPTALPSNTTIVENASIKVEPMGFTFNSPIKIKVPTYGQDVDDLALLHYNEYTGQWEVVPFSSINSDGTVSVSVIELGYFVLVKYTSEQNYGGVHIAKRYLDEDYYYYLTLTPYSNSTGSTKRISFAPNGSDLYMANVPLGKYYVTISRELRSSLGSASSKVEYYSYDMTCNVRSNLVASGSSYSSYTGWTEITFSDNYWTTGRPTVWGDVTTTYGTGKFQATLTWVNSTGSITDYDLHLYGPSDIHVWFSNKNSGSFELDRDWIDDLGNAVENIYTINDNITPGTYYVKVHHYSGASGKRYNCRVILDGVVVKSTTGMTSGTDDIYSFIIE